MKYRNHFPQPSSKNKAYFNTSTSKHTTYKIRNHACLIIVYNHPTSLRQDQRYYIQDKKSHMFNNSV